MNAEIINIGDEILLGQVDNTNAAWLTRRLTAIGVEVQRITVIPDSEKEILQAFQKAFLRSDVTLITGGLGPTHDDLTKGLIAKFFNLPIVFRPDILSDVKQIFKNHQLSFVESNREQAEFPEGATPIKNSRGTAPGIWVERDGKIFASMPGVPKEMHAMMESFVLPRLQKRRQGKSLFFRTLYTFGIFESRLYQLLDNREEILKYAKLAFLPSYRGVRMRLTVQSNDLFEATGRLNEAENRIREKVNDYIIGVDDEYSTERKVGMLLREQRMKIATAESCTAGLLAKRFTDISGSSEWFERGFVTYSNEAKNELLGVPFELIDTHGAVSPEVAEAMATGALRNSRAQVAISITGIAGPTGGTDEKPVGLVYIGYADRKLTTHKKHLFGDDRSVNRERSATAAITLLLEQLLPGSKEKDAQLV